jgi:hypothetical protein
MPDTFRLQLGWRVVSQSGIDGGRKKDHPRKEDLRRKKRIVDRCLVAFSSSEEFSAGFPSGIIRCCDEGKLSRRKSACRRYASRQGYTR